MGAPLDLGPIKDRAGVGSPTPAHECIIDEHCPRCVAAAEESASDVPALIAEVERLRAALAEFAAAADDARDHLNQGEQNSCARKCADRLYFLADEHRGRA